MRSRPCSMTRTSTHHHPGQEQDHATSMITKGTTLHPGLVVLRADSAFYGHDIIATAAGSRSHS